MLVVQSINKKAYVDQMYTFLLSIIIFRGQNVCTVPSFSFSLKMQQKQRKAMTYDLNYIFLF